LSAVTSTASGLGNCVNGVLSGTTQNCSALSSLTSAVGGL
jgi:hypothetical protein